MEKIKQNAFVKKVGFNRIILVAVMLLMYLAFGALTGGKFFTVSRLMNIFNYVYFLGFLALGVTFVIATGGIDYFGKKAPDNKNFGGGGGTGVTVAPVGFLVVDPKGKVELLNINAESRDPVSQIIGLIESSPEIIEKFKNLFSKKDKDNTDEEF